MLESVHSGYLVPIILPGTLPKNSFLRIPAHEDMGTVATHNEKLVNVTKA